MMTREQFKAALALLKVTVVEFAERKDMPGQTTIHRYLRGGGMRAENRDRMEVELQSMGVEFIGTSGVKLKER